MKALSHPNIIRALDARVVDGIPLLVTEFAEGEDLQRIGKVPVPVACDIVRQIADALRFAHERGVIHRDVKPQNVMFDEKTGIASQPRPSPGNIGDRHARAEAKTESSDSQNLLRSPLTCMWSAPASRHSFCQAT